MKNCDYTFVRCCSGVIVSTFKNSVLFQRYFLKNCRFRVQFCRNTTHKKSIFVNKKYICAKYEKNFCFGLNLFGFIC